MSLTAQAHPGFRQREKQNKTSQSYSAVPLVFVCLILTFQKLDFYLDRVSSFFCKVQDSKYLGTFGSPLLLLRERAIDNK